MGMLERVRMMKPLLVARSRSEEASVYCEGVRVAESGGQSGAAAS